MTKTAPPIGLPLWIGEMRVDGSYRIQRAGGTADRVLMVTESGAGRIGHRGGWFPVGPGDLVAIDPGIMHDYGTDPDRGSWRFLGLHVQAPAAWGRWWRWPPVARGITVVHLTDQACFSSVVRHLREASAHLMRSGGLRVPLAMNALEAALLTATAATSRAAEGWDPRLERVVERIERDLAHPWSVAEGARIAGLSPSHFAHSFRERFAETPRRFIERRRLEEAANRLRATSLSAERIANDLGFSDNVHFTRRFRTLYGLPPGRWRTSGE